ncbi:LacI family DNA-binding transcriptional regulator [Rhodoluna sp.]|uniref:LacI family DNA-binding transcriptional regulator n=1 Tax=Rhodoluna sp. TaxID=1969481 RepID=UPI0025D1D06A|nr:LacI family DNA-binding transcriptional regulator [Rhodoluna sp.]
MAINTKDSGTPRPPTMADIAAAVGVSRQLVGLVFRGAPGVGAETEAKIRAAAKELGYRPNLAAQALRREGSKYIGVVFHTDHSSINELIPEVYRQASKFGFQVILSAVSEARSEVEAIEEVLGHRCDGIILMSSGLSLSKIQKLAQEMPLVSMGRRLTKVRCGFVSSRGEAGMFEAVEYLVHLGHKSITYVDGSEMYDHEFRLEGYSAAMAKAKLKTHVMQISGNYTEVGGATAADRLLALKVKPTAVICSNDQMAFGLVHELQKNGISVPRDISVIGYDDTIAKWPFLNLTTVRQDAAELAQAAVEDLAARIRGEKLLSETYLTSSKLVIRSTTGKPRANI